VKRFVGYHERFVLPLQKGDVVTIRRGTTIRTTHPRRGPSYVAGRSYKVTVHSLMTGSSDRTPGPNGEVVLTPRDNPAVQWPGDGGYWCWVDINDIPETAAGDVSRSAVLKRFVES